MGKVEKQKRRKGEERTGIVRVLFRKRELLRRREKRLINERDTKSRLREVASAKKRGRDRSRKYHPQQGGPKSCIKKT